MKQSSIFKFQDEISLESISFVSKFLINLSPSAFNTWFPFSSNSTQGNLIRLIDMGSIQKP